MSNYVVADPFVGAPTPVSGTDTVQRWPLGLEVRAVDAGSASVQLGGAVFVYCQGSNVASGGQFVHIINNSAVLLASGNSASFYPIGVAAGAMTATNVYGWVQVQGLCDYGRVSNSDGAAGVRLALASTAGQIGTVTALGSRIQGIIAPVSWTSTQSASITVQLNRPFVIGVTASN